MAIVSGDQHALRATVTLASSRTASSKNVIVLAMSPASAASPKLTVNSVRIS
jgi:hypothetical protein